MIIINTPQLLGDHQDQAWKKSTVIPVISSQLRRHQSKVVINYLCPIHRTTPGNFVAYLQCLTHPCSWASFHPKVSFEKMLCMSGVCLRFWVMVLLFPHCTLSVSTPAIQLSLHGTQPLHSGYADPRNAVWIRCRLW